jgi:hypothetical protein
MIRVPSKNAADSEAMYFFAALPFTAGNSKQSNSHRIDGISCRTTSWEKGYVHERF